MGASRAAKVTNAIRAPHSVDVLRMSLMTLLRVLDLLGDRRSAVFQLKGEV
jgi:hypothetical protein